MSKSPLAALGLWLLASVSPAQSPKFGVGVFGGASIPVAQKDQGTGSDFGVRFRAKLLPFIVVEPHMSFVKWGQPGTVEGIDLGIDGTKVTSFGLDATLGGLPGAVGFRPFAIVGAASYKVKNDDTGLDQSRLGMSGGAGFAIGVTPKIDVNARAKLVIIPLDGGGSKKAMSLTGGLGYSF